MAPAGRRACVEPSVGSAWPSPSPQGLRAAQDGRQPIHRLGAFNRIFAVLAAEAGEPDAIMIDAAHLNSRRMVASLLKEGLFPDVSGAPEAA